MFPLCIIFASKHASPSNTVSAFLQERTSAGKAELWAPGSVFCLRVACLLLCVNASLPRGDVGEKPQAVISTWVLVCVLAPLLFPSKLLRGSERSEIREGLALTEWVTTSKGGSGFASSPTF